MSFKQISVIGLGYIGLPTAAILSAHGYQVTGIDTNRQVVDTVNQGLIHITEPGLASVVSCAVRDGNLRASTQSVPADVFLIAVPTPFDDQRQPDLSYIHAAIHSIAPKIKSGNLLVLESTSPVGTTELIAEWLHTLRPDLALPGFSQDPDIFIAYCPERVLPGKIMSELVSNDRVIGGITRQCAERAKAIYQRFLQGQCLLTDARTAEMCKLTENSFRDVNIAFANELSMICQQLGIDVWQLIKLANHHPRVNILQPGPGVGGHCIAVDPWFIISKTPERARLIRTAREVNDNKPLWVVNQVKQHLADLLNERNCQPSEITIACFGLAFKANIDDLRESPAIHITERLADWHKGKLLVVEPYINQLPAVLANKATLVEMQQAVIDADILLMLTDHQQFTSLSEDILKSARLVDTRGVWL